MLPMFSLIPTPSKGKTETLDLISKLGASRQDEAVNDGPLQPMKFNENAFELPGWVSRVANELGSPIVWFVMEKDIFASDASDQQNRFMIKKHAVVERIVPILTRAELAAANLVDVMERAGKKRRVDRGERVGNREREHGGLEVMVYCRGGWGCPLLLTRWEASQASVLKGKNYKEFHRRCGFAVKDRVEMWAFRNRDGRLCFAIGKQIDLELSL
ncbi:hypothetical protein HPP92_005017 [Vanilla planifolia]|uniref:Uncharacterized protein n=1 Tax=Vanilla planifolia TaxID=51239 RepID=A0A835RNW6_VANPL|nr:hypothetical protein HPP92_005017 [Vanilla planifolia]